jgi:soluble lytic murein transglycosylase
MLLCAAPALAQTQPSRPGIPPTTLSRTVPAPAAPTAEERLLLDAREALRRGDRARLASVRQQLVQAQHPLASWADYWELSSRLNAATADEVEAFLERWRDTYVEDRLRNDWLLETGRRRDWIAFSRELPRFRMNDDREVRCYGLLVEALSGRVQKAESLAAWMAQRDADNGCHQLATHLVETQQIGMADVWRRVRVATETARPRAARQAAQLIGVPVVQALDALWDKPDRFLSRLPGTDRALQPMLGVLAVVRLAAQDPQAAAEQMAAPWAQRLRDEWAAAGWAAVARGGAIRQHEQAGAWAERALQADAQVDGPSLLGDDARVWLVRALLRDVAQRPAAWAAVIRAIDRMDPEDRADPAWRYWRARALLARSRPGGAGDAQREEAQALLRQAASPLHFYGQLALEALGERATPLPEAPVLEPAERDAALATPGLQRGLRLIEIGLRSEGVREWNFMLIGRSDRELLAAARMACERQIVDRCIGAAERTREVVDPSLRYPLPFHDEITAAAQAAGLEPALVFGLIRQESRFVVQARSHVGASGLMQVMPPTARWTARRIGLELPPDWRDDRGTNLRLGTSYLRMVIDDFGGSLPMALAGYNAGPGRPRRWRDGPPLEPAIWAETIPIHETRDYVKKVLANATVYARRLGGPSVPALQTWLGPVIGPRDPAAPEPNKELP